MAENSVYVINVKVSEDEMEAFIRVSASGANAEVYKKDIDRELKKSGVISGVIDEEIERICKEKKYNEDHLIARGKMPVLGKDTEKEFFFETKPKEPKPVMLNDGRVDHYNLDTVEMVTEGQLLAKMTRPTKGTYGMTVTGRELKTRDGRDIPIRAGQNVTLSEDGLEFYAKITGFPTLIGSKVQVSKQYVVEGSVDFSTGNIDFDGDVLIKGDVLDGFKVSATGNIDVLGNIKNATVEAGATVNALGGIVAKEKGTVRAGVDINAIFVESGTLIAGNVVDVKSAIMHSNVTAGRAIFCAEGKGLIVGGELKAGELIQAKDIGSEYATKTRLTIGNKLDLKQKMSEISAEIGRLVDNYRRFKENNEKLEDSIEAVESFLPIDEQKLSHLKGLQAKVMEAQKSLTVQLRDKKDELQQVQLSLENLKDPKLTVRGSIFPGVAAFLNGLKFSPENTQSYMTIYEKNAQVKTAKYVAEEKTDYLISSQTK